MEKSELAAVFYLVDNCNLPLETAVEQMDEVELREASLEEVAREWFDEFYLHEVPERVQPYIDYEGFAHDCRIAGDLREFQFGGMTWTCTNVH